MSQRTFTLAGTAAVVIAITVFEASQVRAQSRAAAASARPAPRTDVLRTPWGDPNLQGVWDSSTITPLERPAALAGKAVFTEAEAAEYERKTAARIADGSAQARTEGIQDRAVWFEPGTKVVPDRRTSLIVDPPDGRVPPLTAEGRRRMAARAELRTHLERTDGPEDRELNDRCLGAVTPPMTPRIYNNNMQIVQTHGSVVILTEMTHDARVVPLDGRPHLPADVRQWMGDARGRWEGQTLVVDTTNFADRPLISAASPNMHLIERFTRIDATTLRYEFTVDDPTSFSKVWTAVIPMKSSPEKTRQQIYEYACHEGNYSLLHMLEAARAADNAAAAPAPAAKKN